MVAKESVKARFERPDVGISYTEFSYMLLQAYDFLHLFDHYGCRLQMGASDQWGNITMGVELIRKVRGGQAWALTSPLVLKADGTKFGKTETGGPCTRRESHQPVRVLPVLRALCGRGGRHATCASSRFSTTSEITALDEATVERPRAA